MNTTRFHTRPLVRALACTPRLLLLSLLPSCSLAFPAHDDGGAQVKVENARYTGKTGGELEAACLDWSLTPEQVRTFFDLGRRYKENPYSEFYQLPCIISGRILAEDRIWHFEINGGGTATWSSDGQTRYWGCRAERCGSLVLLLSDGMSGD